jgi:hypothetical protein
MTTTDATTATPAKPQKSFGHRLLMRYGQKLSRKIAVFQGKQSLVGNEPVIDVAHFPNSRCWKTTGPTSLPRRRKY